MSVMKTSCPNCRVPVVFQENQKVVTCDYCRKEIRRPEEDDEESIRKMTMQAFELCNSLQFEKAEIQFNQILSKAPGNPEALWGMICCHYGVQILYEDGTNRRYVISNNSVKESIKEYQTYKLQLMSRVSGKEKIQYQKDAESINRMQKEFMRLKEQGVEYDVFLCYKETERYEDLETQSVKSRKSKDADWVRAIYDHLSTSFMKDTEDPIKVFFAPVSLQQTLSTDDYAASISYALSTARVMLVIGSQRDYFEAPWVCNEWTRAQKYIDAGRDRIIIPICKGGARQADPNDLLPEGLNHKEAYIVREQQEDMIADLAPIMKKIRFQMNQPDLLDPYRRNYYERKYNKLNEKYHTVVKELESFRRQHDADKTENERIRSKMKETEENNRRLQLSLDSANASREEYLAEINRLKPRAEMADIEKKKREDAETDSAVYRKEWTSATRDIFTLKEEIKEQEEQRAHLEREIKKDEEQKAYLEQELMKAEERKTFLEQELKKAREVGEEAQKAVQQSEYYARQVTELQEKLKQAIEKSDLGNQQSADLRSVLEEKERQLALKEKEAKSLMAENAMLQGKIQENKQPEQAKNVRTEYPIRLSGYGFMYEDERRNRTIKYGPDLRAESAPDLARIDMLYIDITNTDNRVNEIKPILQNPNGEMLHFIPESIRLKPKMGCRFTMPLGGSVRQWNGVYKVFIGSTQIGTMNLFGNI